MTGMTMTRTMVKAQDMECETRYIIDGREVETVAILMDKVDLIIWDVVDVDGYHDTAYFEPEDEVEVI